MLTWVPYPFLRICPAFIAGIFAAIYFDRFLSLALFLLAVSIIAYIILALVAKKEYFHRLNSIIGVLGLLSIFLVSYVYTVNYREINDHDHISNEAEAIEYYVAVASEDSEEKPGSNQTILAVKQIKTKNGWKTASGKVMLFQRKSPENKPLRYGDQILVKGSPWSVARPANPAEFDYKKYLAYQNIYHQHFLQGHHYLKTGNQPPNPILACSYYLRRKCAKLITLHIDGLEERQIALALILGIKDSLNNKIKQAYASAGAMHVLAVSGLHVGIIYGLLWLLLGRLMRFKNGKWLFGVISIVILWCYALITGFSPSVLRAVTMFSFIIIAMVTKRQTNIYNTLAASAFVLLFFDPFLIKSVGFQLSYIAVAGIVYLQPKVYNLLGLSNYWLDKLWALTSVSIAAQAAVFPLSIFYFHQFPSYFFLSNMVVIPGAFLIVSVGLATILAGALGVLASFLGKCLEFIISWVNSFVYFIDQLPYSSFDHLHFSVWQTILVYGSIISFILFFSFRKFKYMLLAFTLFFGFSILRFKKIINTNSQQNVTFYSINGHSLVDFTYGNESLLWGNENGKAYDLYKYYIMPNRLKMGINKFDPSKTASPLKLQHAVEDNLQIVVWNRLRFILIDIPLPKEKWQNKIKIDYLIIQKNAIDHINELTSRFEFDQLIIDSSNKKWHADRLVKQAKSLDLSCHSVPHEGAFVIDTFQ